MTPMTERTFPLCPVCDTICMTDDRPCNDCQRARHEELYGGADAWNGEWCPEEWPDDDFLPTRHELNWWVAWSIFHDPEEARASFDGLNPTDQRDVLDILAERGWVLAPDEPRRLVPRQYGAWEPVHSVGAPQTAANTSGSESPRVLPEGRA